MTLEATFSLTPRSSYFFVANDTQARIAAVQNVNFYAKVSASYRYSFDNQHAQDELFFQTYSAVDPSVDYSNYQNRKGVSLVRLYCNLASFGTHKELALIFGFDAVTESRLLIFSDAEQLGDEVLNVGDNQFLIVSEGLETPLNLYFIHADSATKSIGGGWFFRGVTGYVV